MKRTSRAIGLAIVAALALPAAARALDVIDDWRKVGPPDAALRPKGRLGEAAAEELVAAIATAWRSGQPLRARGEQIGWIFDNLAYVFRRADGLPVPSTLGPTELQEGQRDLLRQIDVLGSLPAGSRRLLLVVANVTLDEPSATYVPSALGVVLSPEGTVRDVAILSWYFADGGRVDQRAPGLDGARLRIADMHLSYSPLCDPEGVRDEARCAIEEGEIHSLELGADGRFVEKGRRPLNLTGCFADFATGEQILVAEDRHGRLGLGYRGKGKTAWAPMRVVAADPARRIVTAKFEKSPVTYTLTLSPDGKTLASAGSDGSRPQRFARVPLEE